tara:strand:- start:16086 stop:16346 length:261 start_codon:yes stop_codon:yes gene_type:complete
LKIIVEALTTGGLTDWLWKSLAVCFKKVLNELLINLITIIDNAISLIYVNKIINGVIIWDIQRNIVVEEKWDQKKEELEKRIRKNN